MKDCFRTHTPYRVYSVEEWEKIERTGYTGELGDYKYFRDLVEEGELPEWIIGRRTQLTRDECGTVLITEGMHFFIKDERGYAVANFHGVAL